MKKVFASILMLASSLNVASQNILDQAPVISQTISSQQECAAITTEDPPLITDNSYWRLVKQGKAQVIPDTEIDLGIISDANSRLSSGKIAFQQCGQTYYVIESHVHDDMINLLDYYTISPKEGFLNDGYDEFLVEVSALAEITPGTTIAIVENEYTTTVISKPDLPVELAEFFAQLGFEYVMTTTGWICDAKYYTDNQPRSVLSYSLLASQEDIILQTTSADGYSLDLLSSDGIIIRLEGYRTYWHNDDSVYISNHYNYDCDIRFGYFIPTESDGHLHKYPINRHMVETDALAEFSPASLAIPETEIQELCEKFTAYETEPLSAEILQSLGLPTN